MKLLGCLSLLLLLDTLPAARAQDYVENIDSQYNNLTVEKIGSVVELRARSRQGLYLESAVDLKRPLKLQIPYTATLFSGLFFKPDVKRVLVVGLGGAGFQRLFAAVFPEALLRTIELDPKVASICKERLEFDPTPMTPVTISDGRMYIKHDQESWDWIILDAFRGGYVPPHLKTQEFYQECATRLSPGGVLISNLHSTSQLYFSDIKTLKAVFPRVVLFATRGRGNVIACAVKDPRPDFNARLIAPSLEKIGERFGGNLDLNAIADEQAPIPVDPVSKAQLLTDDFSPAEFLDTVRINDSGPTR